MISPKKGPVDNIGRKKRPLPNLESNITKLRKRIKKLESRVEELEDRLQTALETAEHNGQMLQLEIENIKGALGIES